MTGGLCGDVTLGGIRVERYYHHVFNAEREVQELIHDCGLSKAFRWHKVTRGGKTAVQAVPGMVHGGGLIAGIIGDIRFGIELIGNSDITRLDDRTALDWLGGYFKPAVLGQLWVPLLRKKFGRYYADVSAWWLADRLLARLSSSNFLRGTETLGYLEGGFGRLTDSLTHEIVAAGGIIERGVTVIGMEIRDGLVKRLLTSRGDVECHDQVVSTIPRPALSSLEGFPVDLTGGWPPYMACICPVLQCRKPVSPHYWISVGSDSPFVAIIEQSKLFRHEEGGVVYLPDYIESDPEPSAARISQAADIAVAALPQVLEDFDVRDVVAATTSYDRYCQPVFLKGCLKQRGQEKGLPRNLRITDPLDDFPNQTRGMAATIRRAAVVVAAMGKP